MNLLQTFQVFPNIPADLSLLETLARNLWWSWNPTAADLFHRIEPQLWQQSARNPVLFLTLVPQSRLEELSRDDSFLSQLARVRSQFENRVLAAAVHPGISFAEGQTIGYFSMEFGIHESLRLFAGGLGILAGDHLKAASNIGLPLTGVGLLYSQGYFLQYLNSEGLQQEEFPETDLFHLPIERARDTAGREFLVSVNGPSGTILAAVWRVQIGRTPLFLLDTNILENPPEIRSVTSRLYAGDAHERLAQEIVLGIGGIKALAAMGIEAKVCHMNEGHSAFSSLERLAQCIETRGVDLATAQEIIPRSTVFTTHTPVAAGHDEFPAYLVRNALAPFQDRLGASLQEILSWGQQAGASSDSPLSMFILGLRMAEHLNGVSQLHGRVARRMWAHVWPERPEEEIPISHVTNGVHVSTWLAPEMALLFERYLGPDWHLGSRKPNNVRRIDDIYDEELWRAHEINRSRLIRACRDQMVRQFGRRNAPKAVMEDAESVLDGKALTIGFARRFATYKRATLLLQDPERLEALLNNERYPVQIIMSGKAHPKDNEGKALIQKLVEFSRRPAVRRKMLFLEDYDMGLARLLVQGVDVWLNTPRRPFEACGTSGMKAALNGVLNVSILDGWWAEGYCEACGWKIGNGEELGDPGYLDAIEGQAVFNVLENDVLPLFFERRNGDAPARWIRMMKAAMKMAMGKYCSLRMVGEYWERYYLPAAARYDALVANSGEEARRMAMQHARLRAKWGRTRVSSLVREPEGRHFRVGDSFRATAVVSLGELRPEEVDLQLYYGPMKSVDKVASSRTAPMEVMENLGDGEYLYGCTLVCELSGRYGFTVRLTPRGDDWIRNTPGLITWAG
jgi:starch phosphorylase